MKLSALAMGFLVVVSAAVQAEDLGVRGSVASPDADARQQLKSVIQKKYQTGEVDRYWQQFRDKQLEAIKHPAPLPGVSTNYVARVEDREMRFVVPADYKDEKGNVLARRGTVIEPLKTTRLSYDLIFIDGRDQAQVDYAVAYGQKRPTKIILTAGSPYELRIKYKDQPWLGTKTIPFYFDQRRAMLDSFSRFYGININTVPTLLSQQGDKMHIQYGMVR